MWGWAAVSGFLGSDIFLLADDNGGAKVQIKALDLSFGVSKV